MSESAAQTAIQTALQALSDFADADVVINDWSVLDQSKAHAPYVIIETADAFEGGAVTGATRWEIVLNLFVSFDDWTQAKNDFRDVRQAIIDAVDSLANAYPVRSGGNVTEWYDQYADGASAEPAFLSQRLIVEYLS